MDVTVLGYLVLVKEMLFALYVDLVLACTYRPEPVVSRFASLEGTVDAETQVVSIFRMTSLTRPRRPTRFLRRISTNTINDKADID